MPAAAPFAARGAAGENFENPQMLVDVLQMNAGGRLYAHPGWMPKNMCLAKATVYNTKELLMLLPVLLDAFAQVFVGDHNEATKFFSSKLCDGVKYSADNAGTANLACAAFAIRREMLRVERQEREEEAAEAASSLGTRSGLMDHLKIGEAELDVYMAARGVLRPLADPRYDEYSTTISEVESVAMLEGSDAFKTIKESFVPLTQARLNAWIATDQPVALLVQAAKAVRGTTNTEERAARWLAAAAKWNVGETSFYEHHRFVFANNILLEDLTAIAATLTYEADLEERSHTQARDDCEACEAAAPRVIARVASLYTHILSNTPVTERPLPAGYQRGRGNRVRYWRVDATPPTLHAG
jgi:hypothetical protein